MHYVLFYIKNADANVFFPFDCFIFQICTLGLEDLLSAPYYNICLKESYLKSSSCLYTCL